MTNAEPGWELYRSFLAVVRQGSLSAAARTLATTQPTIGRHIEALERGLGVSLFSRSRNGLRPNPAALGLIVHAEAMEASAAALLRGASGSVADERGTVRLTSSVIIGGEVLPAILATFRRAHPQIALELALTNEAENLLRRDADLAVRMFRPTQGALIAKHIGKVGIGLYAHRNYAEAFGLPRTLKELDRYSLIGFDRKQLALQTALRSGMKVTREQFNFRCDDDLAQLAALRAGIGIGACQIGIAKRDPDLLPVFPGKVSFSLDMWLVMHKDLKSSRRVSLLFDHLAIALPPYVATCKHAQQTLG